MEKSFFITFQVYYHLCILTSMDIYEAQDSHDAGLPDGVDELGISCEQ